LRRLDELILGELRLGIVGAEQPGDGGQKVEKQ